MISLGTWAPRSPSANPKRRQQGEEETERAGALRQWLQQREAGELLLRSPPACRQAYSSSSTSNQPTVLAWLGLPSSIRPGRQPVEPEGSPEPTANRLHHCPLPAAPPPCAGKPGPASPCSSADAAPDLLLLLAVAESSLDDLAPATNSSSSVSSSGGGSTAASQQGKPAVTATAARHSATPSPKKKAGRAKPAPGSPTPPPVPAAAERGNSSGSRGMRLAVLSPFGLLKVR